MEYIYGDIFDSNCNILVNSINSQGVVNSRLNLQFVKKYPNLLQSCKEKCNNSAIFPGKPYIHPTRENDIMNVLIRIKENSKSHLTFISHNLCFIRGYIMDTNSSIALPALGCGSGGLKWKDVNELYNVYLKDLDNKIEIYYPLLK